MLIQEEVKEIYVWEDVEKPEYVPTANTLAYFPLTVSAQNKDKSGNGNNFTSWNSSIIYKTVGGVECATNDSITSSGVGYSKAVTSSVKSSYVVNLWFYNKGASWIVGATPTSSSSYRSEVWLGVDGAGKIWFWTPNGTQTTSTYIIDSGWNNICLALYTSTFCVYNNGQRLFYAPHGSPVYYDKVGIGAYTSTLGCYGGWSNVIFEGAAWTAAKVEEYYNNTKVFYGK